MKTKKKPILYELDKKANEYASQMRNEGSVYLPLHKVSFADFFSDRMLLVNAIRKGISFSFFNLIQQYTQFSDTDWAGFLGISTKSLQRYRQSGKNFKPLHSEKIIELAEVSKLGLEVFKDMKKFKLWLNTPNFGLGKKKPVDLLADSYGKELVVCQLTNIYYGVFV